MIAPPVSAAVNQPWAGVPQYAGTKTALPCGISRGSTAMSCQYSSCRDAPRANRAPGSIQAGLPFVHAPGAFGHGTVSCPRAFRHVSVYGPAKWYIRPSLPMPSPCIARPRAL